MYLSQQYLRDGGVSITLIGIVFSGSVLISALAQKYAYKVEEAMGMKKTIFLATILPGIIYLLMALPLNYVWAVMLFVLLRGSMGMSEPLFSGYRNVHISSRGRATTLSLISMIGGLYLTLMRLIIGLLANYGITYSFIFMGTVIILASILLRVDERDVKAGQSLTAPI